MGGLYLEPDTIDEAVALAAEHGEDARFVAGGTDLVVLSRKTGQPLPPALIAIHRIAELRGVDVGHRGEARIGAATSHAMIEAHPAVVESWTALADGSAIIGSPATRHVGTIGGNLCNGSPAMETGSPLLVLGATVEAASPSGRRTFPVDELFAGPGRTSLEPGELLTAVTVPGTGSSTGSAYVRLDYRLAMEIAVVGAAAVVRIGAGGRIEDARVALTAVAPTCVLVPGLADALRGELPAPEAFAEAGELAASVAQPIDDVRAPADYRRAMLPVIVGRTLEAATRRAAGERVAVPATHSLSEVA